MVDLPEDLRHLKHERAREVVRRTVKEDYPKLDGYSAPFTGEEIARRSQRFNGVSPPTARKSLEELEQRKISVNGLLEKVGEVGGHTVYRRDDPILTGGSSVGPSEVHRPPADHFDRVGGAKNFTGG